MIEWKEEIDTLSKKSELRKELGFSNDKMTLLSVSNYIPLKNLEKLIDEVALISDCELYLIGEGGLKQDFETKIRVNNLSNKIKLIGRQDGNQLKKYYKASDIFVFPSNRDTFGYVVVEALASGLPVICSKNAGASTIIEEGVNGYVLHPQEDFTTRIKETKNNIEAMSLNALNSVAKYTIENKAKMFFNLLKDIK